MDNEKIYGKEICKYSIRQAIEDNVLVDYNIIAPFINMYNKDAKYHMFKVLGKNYDINIILTSLLIITSLKQYNFKHLLIFSNTNEKAKKYLNVLKNI